MLFNLVPFRDESFTSFVSRLCCENLITPIDFFNFILDETSHFLTYSDIQHYEYLVPKTFNIKRFCELSQLSDDEAFNLINGPFQKVFCKVNKISLKHISNLYKPYRSFCPVCLSEKKYFQKIWQLKNITSCIEHSTALINHCPSCNKRIQLISDKPFMHCNHCGYDLKEAPAQFYFNEIISSSLVFDAYVILSLDTEFPYTLLFDKNKFIKALAHIYSFYGSSTHINKSYIKRHYSITSLANICIEINTSLFKLIANTGNCDSYSNKKAPLLCINYWSGCNKERNVLIRSNRVKKIDGKIHAVHYCPKCSLEYLVINKQLKETKGILKYTHELHSDLYKYKTLKELAQQLDISPYKLQQILVYLYTNSYCMGNHFNLYFPVFNQELYDKIFHATLNGINQKQVRRKHNLTQREFLFYYLKVDIYNLRHQSIGNWSPRSPTKEEIETLERILKYCLEKNICITIKLISKFIDMSPEKLRYLGLLSRIRYFKKLQKIKEGVNSAT